MIVVYKAKAITKLLAFKLFPRFTLGQVAQLCPPTSKVQWISMPKTGAHLRKVRPGVRSRAQQVRLMPRVIGQAYLT